MNTVKPMHLVTMAENVRVIMKGHRSIHVIVLVRTDGTAILAKVS